MNFPEFEKKFIKNSYNKYSVPQSRPRIFNCSHDKKIRKILSHVLTVSFQLPPVQSFRDICFVIIQLIFVSSLLRLFTRWTSLKFMARKLSKRSRSGMIFIIFGFGVESMLFQTQVFPASRMVSLRSIESQFKKCGNIQFPFTLAAK